MISISADPYQFKELKNGNPQQLRTTVPASKSGEFKKGDTIEIVSESSKLNVKIISEPMVVIEKPEEKAVELSLEVSGR